MNFNQSAFAEGRALSRKRQIPFRAFVKTSKLLLSLLFLVMLSFQSQAQLDPPPFVDFGSEFTIELDENGHAAATIDAVGGDEFDDNGEPLIFAFSQTDFDCSDMAAPTAVTITVTNAAGISASTVMNAIVEDNMGPILVTNEVVVQLDADGNGSFTSEEVFSTDSRDNCDGPITLQGGDQTVNRDDVARSPFEVVVKGQDQNGNTTRSRATITVLDYVVDETPPTVITQDITVQLDATGNGSISASQIDNGSNDASGIASVEFLTSTTVGELITNGSFDSNASGWLAIGNDGNGGFRSSGGSPEGFFILNGVAALNADPSISQAVSGLIPGTIYTLTGDYRNFFGCCGAFVGQTSFGVDLDGAEIAAFPNPGTTFSPFSVSFTATAETQTIRFRSEINGTDTDMAIDNISISTPAENTTASSIDYDCSQIGQLNEVTLLVTDVNGNQSTATANVTVEDNIVPILVGVPADVTAEFNAVPTVAAVSATDNCGANPVVIFREERIDGISNNNYILTRTWTATDESGNTVSGTQVITVSDATAPIAITRDITVYLDANGNATITPEQVDNGSSDDSGEFTLSLDRTTFNCIDFNASCSASSIEFNGTGIASGANGDNIQNLGLDQLTMEAWVKQNDGDVNSIIRKAGDYDLYIVNNTLYAEVWYEGRASSAQYLYSGPTVSNNAWSHVAFTFDKANSGSGKFYVNGIETVATGTFRSIAPDITLGIGGSTEFGQSFTGLIDDVRIWSVERTNAEINEFKDFCIDANSAGLEAYFKIEANEGTTLTDYSGNGNHLTITGATWSFEGAPIESKGTEVTLTVTDAAGNASSAIANVIVLDNIDPSITLNGDALVFHDAYTDYIDLGATATDNCGTAEVSVDSSVDADVPGAYTVTYTATDASGNEATIARTVIVRDITAPQVSTQPAITLLDEAGNGSISNDDVLASATDDSGTVNISLSDTDFECVDLGDNTVSITGEDLNGNSIGLTTDGLVGYWKFGGANPLVDLTGNWGDLEFVGNASLNNGALDLNSNGFARTTSYNGQTITSKTLISYVTLEGLNVRSGAVISIDGVTTDNFDAIVYAERQARRWMNGSSFFRRTQDLNPGFAETQTDQLIQMAITYENIGGQVTVSIYRNGVSIGSYTSGNASSWTPGNMEILFGARHSIGNTQFGSMDARISKALLYNRALSAQEIAAMNGTPVSVSVVDEIAPSVVGKPIEVTLTASGTVSIVSQDVLVSGADNCGPVTYTLSQDTFGAADAINSPVTIQLTGTDPSGNATSVDVQVTIIDPVPVVVTQDITVSLDENGNAIITPEQIDNGSSSVVGLSGLVLDISNFDCSNVGTPVTVTLTATSTLGSSAVGTAVVTVEENAGPAFLTRESFIIFLDADGVATVTPDQFNRDTVTDNCGVETITFDKTTFNCDEVGFHVINITAYDVHGNSTIGQADVEVRDEIAPIFATRESFIILLDENGQASVTPVDYNSETIITNCNLDRIEFDRTDFGCGDVGFHVINVTAFDGNGLATTTQADVEVRDEIAPTVITQNIIVDLDENGNATISPSDVDGGTFDNCAFTLSLNIDSFSCAQVGENIVELTAHDQNGVFASANATVTVRDVIAPEFLTRESFIIFLDVNGVATVTPDQFNRDTVIDNCGVETITFDRTTFDCNERGFHVINITATDANGNVTVGQADVEVRDEIAPTVITQNIIVDLDENGNATINPSDVDGGTFDNCAFTLSLNIDSFSCAQVGENIVALTAHDQNGVFASANATVTVRDIIAPTVITKDVTVGLDANGAYTVTSDDINDGTFDNCIFDLSVTNNVFDCSTLGEHTVILTATDASGNTTSASAVVTVVDNAGPVIVVKDIDVFLDENGNASITLDDVNEGITDGCGVTSTTIDITSFDCSNLGANTVTLTATDIHGNTSTGTATVTVIDNIAPTVITKNITVDLDANGNAAISPIDVLVQEETTEYCSVTNAGGYGMLLFQYVKRYRNRPSARANAFVFTTRGRTFRKNPDGTATITGTLVDRSDSRDSWSVRLNLKNARDWEEWSALGNTYEGNRRTIGDKYLDWTYYEMGENSELIGTGINRGETIQLTARRGFQVGEAANSLNSNFGISGQFRYTTRRGRGSTGRFYFDLDNCISRTKTTEGPLTDDNCSIASTSLDVTSFDCSNIGDNIVNVTVKDKSGNATTVPATVTVRDVIKPVARAKNITVILGADGTVTIDPKLLDAGSTDNCEIVSYSLSRDTFTCRDIQYQSYYRRSLSVTLTVTDAAGNSSRTVASVYVTERQAPVVSTEPITLVVYGRQRAQASRREISKRVTDNCGVQRLYHQRTIFSRSNAGLNYLWVVAIDNSGNRTNGFVRVNVVDVTKYGRVVPMCYKGRPIRARNSQVQRWLNRGATIGSCDTDITMSTGGTNLTDAFEREVAAEPLIELGAFPNPSQGETTIKFSSDVAGPAMAVVMSPNGVRMNTLFDGEIAANENVEVRYNTSDLPNGVYIIRLVTAGEVRNLKLMVKK